MVAVTCVDARPGLRPWPRQAGGGRRAAERPWAEGAGSGDPAGAARLHLSISVPFSLPLGLRQTQFAVCVLLLVSPNHVTTSSLVVGWEKEEGRGGGRGEGEKATIYIFHFSLCQPITTSDCVMMHASFPLQASASFGWKLYQYFVTAT